VPQANLAYVLWKCDKKDEAKKVFEELRSLAAAAELDVPPFARLAPLAKELGWPADWRQAGATRTDIGNRPPLDSLGPIRYESAAAPEFALTSLDGKPVSTTSLRGRNVVLLFYLGTGCLHCTEQLKAFAAMHKDYQSAGFEVIAVSTDDAATLKSAAAALKPAERYPFTIVPDEDLSVFKKYRAYDDFEKQPLHATIFIDKAGALRWKDVGPEPFMDAKFVLEEAKRLASFTKPTNTIAPPAATVRAAAE
jgi:peroxiredoxin